MSETLEKVEGNGSESPASELLGVAIERAMAMVGVGDGVNRAEHIPSEAEVSDLRQRTEIFLAGACTEEDLTAGLEKGNLIAIMRFVAQEAEQRGL